MDRRLKSSSRALLPSLALLACVWFLVPSRSWAANTCVECHNGSDDPRLRQPVSQVLGSVHRDEALSCVGCHNGDPGDPTAGAHGVDTGFVGHPSREHIPALCGRCHADARIIRRFNAFLPIDQLTLYIGGKHGVGARAGEPAAPVCTDCHRNHDILPVADPRSVLHRTKVAELCGGCHADRQRMASTQLPTDQLAAWQRSAHAAAVARGQDNPPSCTGCHGAHGPLAATVSSVSRVCAKCHAEQLEQFNASAHAKPFRRLGFAECVPCHGTHDIREQQPLLFGLATDGSCGQCHGTDDPARAEIETLTVTFRAAAGRVARARRQAQQAATAGLVPLAVPAALQRLTVAEQRLRLAAHTVDEKLLQTPLQNLRQAAAAVEQHIAQAESDRRFESGWAYGAIGLVALLFVLLIVQSIRLARSRS